MSTNESSSKSKSKNLCKKNQALFSLPMPCALILFGYINYTAIKFYLKLEDSAAVFSYLAFAYGWALISTFKSPKIRITVFDIWTWILITIIALGYFASSGISKELVFVLFLGLNYTFGRHIKYSQLPSLYKCVCAVGFLAFAISVPELPQFFGAWGNGALRPELYGGFAYASAFASSMAILLITTIGLLGPTGRSQIIKGIFALLLILIVINSSARIAILACAVAICTLFCLSKSIKLRKIGLIVTSGLVLGLAIWHLMPESYKEFNSLEEETGIVSLLTEPLSANDSISLESDASDLETTNTVEVRLKIIRSCLVRFLKNPILGYGPNQLPIPHNSFLQVLFEHGIFAAVVFGFIIIRGIYLLLRITKNAKQPERRHLALLFSLFVYILMYSWVMGTTLTMAGIFLFMGILISVVKDHGLVC